MNHDIVAIWDIYPTILSMLKLKVPVGHQVDGEDISPYFRGDSSFHRTQKIFQHFPHHHSYANFYSTCRKGDWKVIYNYMDQYAHTDLYSGNGYRTAGRFPWQLFNLKDDIGESNDLAQDPAQQERLMRMARSLIRELRQADAQYPVLTRNGQAVGRPTSACLISRMWIPTATAFPTLWRTPTATASSIPVKRTR